MDGNELYRLCQETGQSVWLCTGYVVGAADADIVLLGGKGLLCVRPTVTPQQLKDIVIAYLTRHPETRDSPASLLVDAALIIAFTCP